MNVLLTGGTGFFGKALLRHWMAAANTGAAIPVVTVLSRAPDGFLERYPEFADQDWLRLHRGDILDPASLPEGGDFSHVLHAAADSTAGPQLSPLQRYTQIVDGTRNLLEYAARQRIPRFLMTSSGGVYGPQPQGLEQIPEDYHGLPDPLEPAHAYSVAKRCAEHLCILYQQQFGLEVVIARCFAFVGRDLPRDVHFAIGNFIRDALESPAIRVSGDGTPVRSYMDQRDLAHWLDVMLRQGRAGSAYNVGSDEAVTIAELAHQVRDVLSPQKPVHIAAAQATPGSFRNRYVPCIDKARSELGLQLRHGLQQSIKDAAI
ncbi:dTDP-glucose 4,6-dehydratase [Pseudomonas putida]|uniref:dTDP-glucose 4,6-dehydratase n=1 Tax=Pseudomonas putida TaxID=303 RepID=A0AA37RFP1_PSEPU|nr:NAD(P)-dependent oxidoreductase [Pseudomonas putida]GLO12630.1 dTDP-glucose 4,6-dehydratase [Pseudomonas putida]GLO35739.1 dTDP-glucose 4,6-dehydratase [Pseudomonas putida]HDS0962460.1 NAD(P)-dependent oxidoreductase [Pseudomonas putida]HDS0989308.1 NAD(P)-dependent oxidoreductase [Pseudomonas putida]